MEAMDAILTRRSITRVKSDPVPRKIIEKLLLAAVQAPNHYQVRPWRFVVLTGESREALGEVMAQSLKQQHPDLLEAALEKERAKPLRAPVMIAVGVEKPVDPRVLETENICAVAAAVENLLLAAHAEGLGAMWRTGPAAHDQQVNKFLGFQPGQEVLSFVYIGFPDMTPPVMERPSFEDRTVWMN
ncbi:MAG: nitroreductase [Anaerolineales bacterium]|jgi:nitroreductase